MVFESEGLLLSVPLSFPMYLDSIDFSSAKASVWRAVLARTSETLASMSSCLLSIATILAEAWLETP
jgi:hypothetical protein